MNEYNSFRILLYVCKCNVDNIYINVTWFLLQGVKILFNPILSYFFDKILFCPIFWEMSYFLAILPLILLFNSLFITISLENIP